MRNVYLDNNASTRVDPEVLRAMLPFFSEQFGNASSVHTPGQKARQAVEMARDQVAGLIHASPSEILFTSGGTEADNLAIRGAALAYRESGNHIITTRIEHPAVLRTCEHLEREGFEVSYLPPDSKGRISQEQVTEALREDTILVSVMAANNETGAIQPVAEIGALLQDRPTLFHTDAVQAVAKMPVDVNQLRADLLSIAGHKIHGPKGVGALFVRRGTNLQPLMLGGSHERKQRAGTENVPGIVGLGEACRQGLKHLDTFNEEVGRLRNQLETDILESVPDSHVNGDRLQRMPHVTNISFGDLEGEALLVALDLSGIAVSTGAACASGSISQSHVLTAMELVTRRINGAIRFSLSRFTTSQDVDYVLEVLPAIVERARGKRVPT